MSSSNPDPSRVHPRVKFEPSMRTLRMQKYGEELTPEAYMRAADEHEQALNELGSVLLAAAKGEDGSGPKSVEDVDKRASSATSRVARFKTAPIQLISVDLEERPEQLEAIDFLVKGQKRACWDPVGYGKTLEMTRSAPLPFIYATRLHLTKQVADWLADHAYVRDIETGKERPLKVQLCTGSNMDFYSRCMALLDPDFDAYIINHDMTRYPEDCEERCAAWQRGKACRHGKRKRVLPGTRIPEFKYPLPTTRSVILDEAHWFRGRSANMSKGAFELAALCQWVIEGTGTPIYKEPDDLYMQLRILAPLVFSSYWKFVDTFCNTLEQGFKTKIVGTRFERALATLLGRYGIKRPPRNLPPCVGFDPKAKGMGTNPIRVDMAVREYNRYRAVRESYRDNVSGFVAFNASSMISKLYELTFTESKMDAVVDRIKDTIHRSDGTVRRTLVYTWYVDSAHRLRQHIASKIEKDFPSLRVSPAITGNTPAHKRKDIAMDHDIVVANIASFGEGIEGLQEAFRHIICAEEYYTPGTMEQALGRVYRERQTSSNIATTELVQDENGNLTERIVEPEPVVIDFVHSSSLDRAIHASWTRRDYTATSIMSAVMQERD